MSNSATPAGGLRERKRSALRASISDAARALTLEHGFSHFTIEQLCEQVGISRRTFFNYFPSKEDALIGHHEDGVPEHLAEAFVAGGVESPAGEISGSLFDDLVELSCRMMEQSPLDRTQHRKLIAAIEKEPALLAKIIGSKDKWEAEIVELIAEREQLDPDDTRAVTATVLLTGLSQKAGQKYFSADNDDSYRTVLTDYYATAKTLF
ncbi:TetR/AcrR family transcriptional regulator [Arthrobacter castelli]|uniref:TetR/AcrR family transcriptional regulator n=1 Tax=Arthrobacter castelli TaxID=271431 RepID=UPI000686D388|nr:TetR family transcriptional regulator [Arthrobacter castelli]